MEYDTKLDEVLKLSRENNRMLRAMRRNAFLGGILKFLMYAAFIIVPLWFLQPYLATLTATLDQLQKMNSQIQSGGTQAQVQLQSLQDALKKAEQYMPSLPASH